MEVAVPSFGDPARDPRFVDRVFAQSARRQTLARAPRCARNSYQTDVVAPDDGSNSMLIADPTNRNSVIGFLAVSGNPLQWVPCVGRPVTPQAPHTVTSVTQAP